MDNLRIYAMTWNTNAKSPPKDLDCKKLLGIAEAVGGQDVKLPDIYAIGFQELSVRPDNFLTDTLIHAEDAWTRVCRSTLVSLDYVKIRSLRLMGICISIFVKRDHLLHVRDVESQYTRLSLVYSGMKGAVSVRLKIYGTSMCFVNSHLSAHDHLLPNRISEYNTIVENHTFKQEETPNILYHDYIFWMGDLNFRIEEGSYDHGEIVEAVQNDECAKILARDQLNRVRREELAFHELSEKMPTFPPTYKFIVGTDSYNPGRRPAWTDRILHRVNAYNYEDENVELSLEASDYASHGDEDFRCSDHVAVSERFAVSVFGKKLAGERGIGAYDPLVRFRGVANELWYTNEDRQITYELEPGAGMFLSSWDWIGMFREDFGSLDDYHGYCWASSCRRTGEPKTALMSDTTIALPGRFVLVYISSRGSVLGVSQPFQVECRFRSDIELAHEAFDDE